LQLLNNRGDIVVSSVDSFVAQFTDAVRQTPAHHLTIVQRYVGPSHGPEVQRYVKRNPGLSRRRDSRRKQRRRLTSYSTRCVPTQALLSWWAKLGYGSSEAQPSFSLPPEELRPRHPHPEASQRGITGSFHVAHRTSKLSIRRSSEIPVIVAADVLMR
jgi:hypothetical protein